MIQVIPIKDLNLLHQVDRVSQLEVVEGAMSSPARRPLIISSKPRSKPWNYQGTEQPPTSSQPYCTVCVQPNEDIDQAVRRQIEQEVKMIRSRPSVAYKRHSPQQWSQELVLDDVRREEGGQRERLRELRREYKEIETKYKSKIIEDLAGLYYESKEDRNERKLIKSRTVRKTEEVRVDVHQESSNLRVSKGKKSERQLVRMNSMDASEDSSIGQSITITVTRSSKKNGEQQVKDIKNKMEMDNMPKSRKTITSDATSDDDTLNGTLEIDEEEVKPKDANMDIAKVKEENRLLRRKLKKQRHLKTEVERLTEETKELRQSIKVLRSEIASKADENAKLMQSKAALIRQNSINEIPERDVPLRDRLVQTSQKSSSVEVDPFTEVIIDELKKEIRSLKEDVEVRDLKLEEKNLKMESMARDNVDLSKNLSAVINKSKEGVKSFEESFQAKEDKMLAKIKSLKDEMVELKLRTGEENFSGTEVEVLKAEIERLNKLLEQGTETNITLESYVNFLKQSYNATFGPIK